MAYAGALFADACLRGLNGDPDVVECSYVASTVTEAPYFSSKVKLGKNGEEGQRAGPCCGRWNRPVLGCGWR
jgi:malate dehydrogenase